MNEELLETIAVKSIVEKYLKEKLSFEEIKERLENIHLIIVDEEILKNFLEKVKLNKIKQNE